MLYKLSKSGLTTYIGTTDFVDEPNYSGANVIQSMCYDHDENKMYWYAHSQTYHAGTYINIGVTYEVDFSDASCTRIGGTGTSGYTSLFVPTDRTSDIFTPNVTATGIEITPSGVTMAVGQSRRLIAEWKPWNAVPGTVTWESKNKEVATVNVNGVITAVAEGETDIIATVSINDNGAIKIVTHTAKVKVVASVGNIYAYLIRDYNNAGNENSWVTYSPSDPERVTVIGTGSAQQMWQGGAYYNGYVYTVVAESWEEDNVLYNGTALYRFKVTPGNIASETKLTEQTFIKRISDIEVGNLAFDYSTGRMYGVDYTNGGLCLVDIETGGIDLLGTFNGDLSAAVMPAMCVTANGNIIGSDMYGNIYLVNPDTMYCTKLASITPDSWFYASMTYDHNTGNIYWNPCMDAENSDLYLIRVDDENPTADTTEIIELGAVSTDAGVEQTVMFTIPDVEPETKYIQVEDIQITNGETLTGLVGGSMMLKTVTTPLRPTANAKQWKSSDESVVKVDHFGNMTFVSEGTATVAVTISNKGENVAGPFFDTVTVNVYPAAGEMAAFLAYDEYGTSYFDFWISIKDYDPQHSVVGSGMIGTYSLRTGEYYDGYFYAYNDVGKFYRISKDNYNDYVTLGSHGLPDNDQVLSMAFDYTTGTMYALTLHIGGQPGYLEKVDLRNGPLTNLHQLDTCISAFAADETGTLYGVGAPGPYDTASIYRIDKETGSCTLLQELPDGGCAYTGDNYMTERMYSPQMTFDYGTNRLYLNATNKYKGYESHNYGLYMIQLVGEETEKEISFIANLGRPALDLRDKVNLGHVFLGLLCAVPEDDEISNDIVTGIILSKGAARLEVGGSMQLSANVSPDGATDKSVIWSSENEDVAMVDETGLVTGVSTGTAVITATSVSNEAINATCVVTVLKTTEDDTPSTAYTISASQESLVSFDPELPSTTAKKIAALSGGNRIVGMDVMSDNYLYYIVDEGTFPSLYRYDLTTKKATYLGDLEVFIGNVSDMAYDPVNKLIYVVSGFYVFQFEEHRLRTDDLNKYSGYLDTSKADMPLSTMHAVTCKDGFVYFLGSDNGASLYRVNDEFKELTFIRNVGVNTVSGKCEMAYDSRTELFYLTDAGDRLYSFSGDGDTVNMVGDGWDINGLAINPDGVPENDPLPSPKPTLDPTPTPDPTPVPDNPFKDVKVKDYYYEAILWAVEHGITSGITSDMFGSELGSTRADVVTFLWRAAGRPEAETKEVTFEDIEVDAYYYDAICWATENGIAAGYGDNLFAPDFNCTRAEVVTFIWRALKDSDRFIEETA